MIFVPTITNTTIFRFGLPTIQKSNDFPSKTIANNDFKSLAQTKSLVENVPVVMWWTLTNHSAQNIRF